MEQQTKEKMLGIVESEIALYAAMVNDEMERIKKQSDPSLVAISGEFLGKYDYTLEALKTLKKRMEEAE